MKITAGYVQTSIFKSKPHKVIEIITPIIKQHQSFYKLELFLAYQAASILILIGHELPPGNAHTREDEPHDLFGVNYNDSPKI